MKMLITRHAPRFHPAIKEDGEGGTSASYYTDHGLVQLVTYAGGRHGAPFTNIEMWLSPHLYLARLPRHYHPRWLGRLADDFAWRCHEAAQKRPT